MRAHFIVFSRHGLFSRQRRARARARVYNIFYGKAARLKASARAFAALLINVNLEKLPTTSIDNHELRRCSPRCFYGHKTLHRRRESRLMKENRQKQFVILFSRCLQSSAIASEYTHARARAHTCRAMRFVSSRAWNACANADASFMRARARARVLSRIDDLAPLVLRRSRSFARPWRLPLSLSDEKKRRRSW